MTRTQKSVVANIRNIVTRNEKEMLPIGMELEIRRNANDQGPGKEADGRAAAKVKRAAESNE